MAIREVLKYPDLRLRKIAKPVTMFDDALAVLVDDMFETMYHDNGAGLAATQINEHQKIFVLDMSRDRSAKQVFINPEILEEADHQKSEEGCLSFPGVWASVKRAGWVKVKYQDLQGKAHVLEVGGSDRVAVGVQHELDHLNGVLFVDHLSRLKRERLIKKLEKLSEQTNF